MLSLRLAVLSVFALLLGVAQPVMAGSVTIDAPGAYVHADDDGVAVDVSGNDDEVVDTKPRMMRGPSVVVPMAEGVARASTSYVNADLSGMDFSNQDLSGADFTNATLQGVNFAGANLTGANFTNADLSGANLTNANFAQAIMTNATVNQAVAANTNFAGAMMMNVDMSMLVRQAAPRPVYVDSLAIGRALKVDPAHPTAPRKIDLTINFDFNSDKITAQGSKQIDAIAEALKAENLRGSRIMIEGHTDNVGTDAYNDKLSYRRATSVLRALVDQHGISSAGLSAKGYGETQPIASNDDDLGRAMNRRVTLVNLGR